LIFLFDQKEQNSMKNPFQKSRIPEGKAFLIKELIAPFFDVNWHFHSEYQLFVVLKGRGTRFIGDHMQSFREGDMVLTGPDLPHLWKNDKAYHNPDNQMETHGIVIYLPDNFLNDSVYQLEEFEVISNMLKKSVRGIEIRGKTNFLIRQMMLELLDLKGVKSINHLLKILQTIADSSDCRLIADAAYINTNKESEKDRMGQVYEYVMRGGSVSGSVCVRICDDAWHSPVKHATGVHCAGDARSSNGPRSAWRGPRYSPAASSALPCRGAAPSRRALP
jgi:hypothetical protein